MATEDFNIALLPADESLTRVCIDLARSNLLVQSDQYLLGEKARPHVTLCQFGADREDLQAIWAAVEPLSTPPVVLEFDHIYVQAGTKLHAGKTWVGLAVKPFAELIDLQKAIFAQLLALGKDGYTKPEIFFPHLTWARCDKATSVTIARMPPPELWQASHQFNLSLGLSNQYGVYKERLLP